MEFLILLVLSTCQKEFFVKDGGPKCKISGTQYVLKTEVKRMEPFNHITCDYENGAYENCKKLSEGCEITLTNGFSRLTEQKCGNYKKKTL